MKRREFMKIAATGGIVFSLPRSLGSLFNDYEASDRVDLAVARMRLSLSGKRFSRQEGGWRDAECCYCWNCDDACPQNAVWLEKVKVKDRKGGEVVVQQPRVGLELCIGCGVCETKCPVHGKPVVYVLSVGESRSKENRLLLEG